jgi:hypothetical protein
MNNIVKVALLMLAMVGVFGAIRLSAQERGSNVVMKQKKKKCRCKQGYAKHAFLPSAIAG